MPFSAKSLSYIKKIDPVRDIQLIEKTFHFRPVCLRNIRISTTLLKSAAEEGLTLEQIGQILCRPDEDDSMPSLLEKIVQKARQITDMMIKMQMKYKDSKLRAIHNNNGKRQLNTMEEIKLGEIKRSRVNSNYQDGPTRTRDLQDLRPSNSGNGNPSPFMFSLASSLGADGADQYKAEVKPRTMSFDND